MGEGILELIYYIIYSFEIFWIGECIFHNRVKEKKKYILVIVIYLLLVIPTVLLGKTPPFVMSVGINGFIYVCLFQDRLLTKLAQFSGIYAFTGLAEGIISAVLMFVFQNHLEHFGLNNELKNVRMGFAILASFFILILVTGKWAQKIFSKLHILKWYHYLAMMVLALSGSLLMAMSQVMLEIMNNQRVGMILYMAIAVVLLAIVLVIIWFQRAVYSREYYLKQNEMKEEIIHTQQQYYQNIYENDREMRKFRHDIRAQLGCLYLLMQEGKVEQACRHLELIEQNFEKVDIRKYHTGNEILDVIINQKQMEARKKDIAINVKGTFHGDDLMNIYDMCTIFTNAINNAIEAYKNYPCEEKNIDISILEHGRTVFFQFKNQATPKMYEAIKENKTTKKDNRNHGLGVENIRMVVERNNGEMEYCYENGNVILEIQFEV